MSAQPCGCDVEANWVCDRHRAERESERALIAERRQPAIYPCGCSRHKVNADLCDAYQPGELPSAPAEVSE